MTILTKRIKRELPQRVAHRQTMVELHSAFVRLQEKHSRTAWDITWESIYLKAAEIHARKRRAERVRRWN